MNRLRTGLEILNRNHPEAIISVDTFRADVAAQCVNEYGVAIINDIAAIFVKLLPTKVIRIYGTLRDVPLVHNYAPTSSRTRIPGRV